MKPLHDDLLALSMQLAAANPADATALRESLWQCVQSDGWVPSLDSTKAYRTTPGDDDRALLQAFDRGSPEAFDELVKRHGGALLSFAQKSLPTVEAQDAAQNAWLVLFSKRKAVLADPTWNVRAFLFGVARNEIRNLLRKRFRAEEVVAAAADEPQPEGAKIFEDVLRRERTQLVRDLVEHCNPLEQDVVELLLNGETNTEIAEVLELTPNHVGVLRRRALLKLQEAIAQGASDERLR